MNERRHYLDNIRWITLCFVIIYHVFYIFNSSGVVSNIGVTGIKELDSICVFIYPWIMCLLFVVSGVSTKYSLNNKTGSYHTYVTNFAAADANNIPDNPQYRKKR